MTGMQPALVVHDVPLSGAETQSALAACDRPAERGEVRLNHRAPPSQTVLPQSDRHPPVGVDGEDLGGMTGPGAVVRRARFGEHEGCLAAVTGQAAEYVTSIGQENIAPLGRGPQTDEEHQARRIRDAGTVGVCLQLTAAQAGESGAVGVSAGVVDRGEAIGSAVGMGRDGHELGGTGTDLGPGHEPVDRDQAALAKPLSDRVGSVWGPNVDVVGREEGRGSCGGSSGHRRTPSNEVGEVRLGSRGQRGKATDCRLGQFAQLGGVLREPCYVPKARLAHRRTRTAMTHTPPLWPVSVKGVALDAQDRVLLLKNERDEWELPGGRLEIGSSGGAVPTDASPESAVEREIQEETGWEVKAGPLIEGGVWIYEPIPGRKVLIVTYGCTVLTPDQTPIVSHEHKQLGMFTADEVTGLNMPEGYKQAIALWYRRDTADLDDYERM